MCFDPRKPESETILRAAGALPVPELAERLRLAADDQFAAAAELEQLRETIARQGRKIEKLRAEIDRLLRRGREE